MVFIRPQDSVRSMIWLYVSLNDNPDWTWTDEYPEMGWDPGTRTYSYPADARFILISEKESRRRLPASGSHEGLYVC